jgi:hypothetical protein
MYSINYTDLGSAEYKMGDAYRFAFECALMCHCYYSTVVRGRGCTWYYLNRDNCVTVDVIERDRDRQYHLFNVTTQSSIGAGRAVAGAFSNSRDILDEALNVYQVGQNGVITIADGGLLMVRG